MPDAIDALILQAAVNSILPQVLKNQPNKNAFYQAQAHKISKSKEEKISEGEYGNTYSWLAFQKAILNFTTSHNYLVVTDIANFFDTVCFSEIRSIYGSFEGINEDTLDFIFFILESYNWRPDYMPDRQIGLPQMNFDAPRLLAHSFLFELDRHLTKVALGSYARYMDDMDIGVSTVGEGKKILRDIDLVLQTRGVRLNSGKSKIMSAADAGKHYFVRDNRVLNLVDDAIARKRKKNQTNIDREIKLLEGRFHRSYASPGYFDVGNGEKIIKRYLTFFINNKLSLPDVIVEELLLGRPGIREYVLRYVSWLGYPRVYSNQAMRAEFLDMVRRSRNGGSQSVYSLHRNILNGKIAASEVFSYLKAMTPSQPRLITFQKVLLLLSFLRSSNSAQHKTKLKAVYAAAPLDAVEKYLLTSVL